MTSAPSANRQAVHHMFSLEVLRMWQCLRPRAQDVDISGLLLETDTATWVWDQPGPTLQASCARKLNFRL